MDWQAVLTIVTFIGFFLAVGVFIWQVRSFREDHIFAAFLKLLEYYREIMGERRHRWRKIKEAVKENPKTAWEIGDKTSTLDYLLIRVDQEEPLSVIEHGLIEDEVRSLNLLNELCKYAHEDELKSLILKVLYSSEISYYQNRLEDLNAVRDKEKHLRSFSLPRCKQLKKFQVDDYFEDTRELSMAELGKLGEEK